MRELDEDASTIPGVHLAAASPAVEQVDDDLQRLLDETDAIIMAPVYDELVNSVPEQHVVEFCPRLQQIMNLTPPGHEIPMVSEFSVGFDWYHMVEIGTDTSKETILKAIEEARAMLALGKAS